MHHRVGRHPRLGPSDCLGSDGAGLVVPAQYLGDAAVGDLEDPGDVAGPGSTVGQLHDLLSGGVWERSARHEDSTQLVDTAVTFSGDVIMGPLGAHH